MSNQVRDPINAEQTMEMVKLYEAGATFKEIAAKFNRSANRVYSLIRDNCENIRGRKSKVPSEDVPLIVADYRAGIMVKELAIKWKRTKATISKILHAEGFPMYRGARTCTINDDYLSQPMDEHRCYFVGMLLGDGTITNHNSVCLSLTESDRLILDTYRDLIQPGANIGRYEYKDGRGKPYCVLSLMSKKLCERLEELGVGRRKSLTAEYPAWIKGHPHERHLLRGVWDADGWVKYYTKNKQTIMGICGSEVFIKDVEALLTGMGLFCCVHPRAKIFVLSVQRKHDCAKLARYLYQDVRIAIPRKLEAAESMMSLDTIPDGRFKPASKNEDWTLF